MADYLQRALDAFHKGDLQAARGLFERALVCAHSSLGHVLCRLGEPGEEAHYRAALAIDPNDAEAAYNLALFLLRQGRYDEAWPLHERRRDIPRIRLPKIPSARPEWQGEDLSGKRLLVIGEQGLGDQLMFSRFIAPLQADGANVTLACDASLCRLLAGLESARLSDFDFWAYQQSLPLRLGVTAETIPSPIKLPVRWIGGGGVGVVPTGNLQSARNADRALSDDHIRTLLSFGRDLRPEATGASDFYDTAEIMAGIDLVITVDTAAAHLAGSMGVPTWVLLPSLDPDWRWMEGRLDSPWYPSVTLYRQTAAGDWSDVLSRIRKDAGRLVS